MGSTRKLAGIEYSGIAGASHDCQNAVARFLQFGDEILSARILSCLGTHCLLLKLNVGDYLAVKSGFSSGYRGEGPYRFSYTLQMLRIHNVEIDEIDVDEAVIERLDNSALRMSDLMKIEAAKPIRPSRWYEYVYDKHYDENENFWDELPPVIPLAIVDCRIIDLALAFWATPDDKLLKGYRRLEDIVRDRTGIDEHGAKLFSQAFSGSTPPLKWKDVNNGGEQNGRVNLFTGAYMAYRNPRAHRELRRDIKEQVTEFLMLNQLYLMERESEFSEY